MAISNWENTSVGAKTLVDAARTQTGPAVTTHDGTELAVAFINGSRIVATFFDEFGRPSTVTPTVTDSASTGLNDVQIALGGVGIGYGVT